MDIGLTLSGGGFRATLFHLGVVQYLRRAGLLSQITHITSVSGGSILAAHLALNWDRYCGSDAQFEAVARPLIEFTQLGVREHVIAYLPLTTLGRRLPRRFRRDEADVLQKLYARYLFGNARNADLVRITGAPRVDLVATNLSRPDNLTVIDGEGLTLLGERGTSIRTKQLNLAYAVTASSAFPLLFPAMALDFDMLGVKAEDFSPTVQYLTDGGVYDNYGLRALRHRRSGRPFDLLIVSDAGARAGWAPDKKFNRLSLLSRAAAITGQRVSQLELEAARNDAFSARSVVISIHDVSSQDRLGGVPRDLQSQLGAVRTDLDSFSDLLVHCLGSHGYSRAREVLEGSGGRDATEESWNPLSPRIPLSLDLHRDVVALRKASLTPWHLFSLREWRPMTAYLLVLVALLWYGPTIAVNGGRSAAAFIENISRSAWTEPTLSAHIQFGDQAFLGTMRAEADEAEKERFRKERVFRWMNDGIRPMNRREQVIVVESPPFDRHYREFQLSIIANRDIKLAEGVGFLIGNDGPGGVLRPHFRQLTMSFAPNGDNPPTVTLSSPNPGEKLLLMFKAESLSPDPAAVLPSSPDSFGISLRSR